MERRPHILVIFGSTRQGRRGERVVDWLMGRLDARSDASFALVDVRRLGLPLFDAAVPPARGQVMPEVEAWAAQVERADGFIFVTPEYNHGYPAALKNATPARAMGPIAAQRPPAYAAQALVADLLRDGALDTPCVIASGPLYDSGT